MKSFGGKSNVYIRPRTFLTSKLSKCTTTFLAELDKQLRPCIFFIPQNWVTKIILCLNSSQKWNVSICSKNQGKERQQQAAILTGKSNSRDT